MSLPKKRTTMREHFTPSGQPKKSYDDELVARRAARQQKGSARRQYRAYQCSVCLKWHIGRKPASKSQKQRQRKRDRRLADALGAQKGGSGGL